MSNLGDHPDLGVASTTGDVTAAYQRLLADLEAALWYDDDQVADARQLFTRPSLRLDPYSTPHPRLFLCSQSTPPGGGVHGMCGFYAARSALRRQFGKRLQLPVDTAVART